MARCLETIDVCIWHMFVFMSVVVITERRDMDLYEVPLSMSLLGFGMGTMLANFHMCGIILMVRAVLSMLIRNAYVFYVPDA